jgi:hypothetical protein
MSGTIDEMPKMGEQSAGRRKKRFNPWLDYVKETMRKYPGVSFKKILKIAKKTFKKSRRGRQSQSQSQSQSQNGGKTKNKKNKSYSKKKRGGSQQQQQQEQQEQQEQQQQQQQQGGSGVGGGKEGAATLAGSAAPVA